MDWQQLSKEVEASVRNEIDLMQKIEDESIAEQIDQVIIQKSREQRIPLQIKLKIKNDVFHSLRGYDCLEDIFMLEDVSEIMINGYKNIYVERNGVIEPWMQGFSSEEKYMDVIQQVVASCNRIVNESSPIVDARLKDGSRVNVVLPPIALDGAIMTIRRFPKEVYLLKDLRELGMFSEDVERLLTLLTKSRYNIMISGGTGSGKTTVLNALANQIPEKERIITIEDSAELQIKGIPNLVRLEARNVNVEGKNQISIKDLIKSALRMRPDRIIVGEVRGEEALDMLQAMNTGHSGSLSTGHSNSGRDILYRLETMVLMGMDMPLAAIRQQIASAIDIVIHIGRCKDGSRRVLEISELLGMHGGEIQMQTILRWDGCRWRWMNGISNQDKMQNAGYLDTYKTIFDC